MEWITWPAIAILLIWAGLASFFVWLLCEELKDQRAIDVRANVSKAAKEKLLETWQKRAQKAEPELAILKINYEKLASDHADLIRVKDERIKTLCQEKDSLRAEMHDVHNRWNSDRLDLEKRCQQLADQQLVSDELHRKLEDERQKTHELRSHVAAFRAATENMGLEWTVGPSTVHVDPESI